MGLAAAIEDHPVRDGLDLTDQFIAVAVAMVIAGRRHSEFAFVRRQRGQGRQRVHPSWCNGGGRGVYRANFHTGVIQAREAKGEELNARLKADGYEVPEPARLHGSWKFYFTAPGGFTVEVLA